MMDFKNKKMILMKKLKKSESQTQTKSTHSFSFKKFFTVSMIGLIIWTFLSILYHRFYLRVDIGWAISMQLLGFFIDAPITFLFEWVLMKRRRQISRNFREMMRLKNVGIPKFTLRAAGLITNMINCLLSFLITLELIYVLKMILLYSLDQITQEHEMTGIMNSLYFVPVFSLVLGPVVILKREKKNILKEIRKLRKQVYSDLSSLIHILRSIRRETLLSGMVFVLYLLRLRQYYQKFWLDFWCSLWLFLSKI
jgi:hypothetical protein